MHQSREVRSFLAHFLFLLALCPQFCDSLIITSVLAGDKKFKTISFDHKFLKPLTFEKEMPLTEFRRHRTLRPPKFDIDINIPIKLPLEDEYGYEEPNKPVTSDFFLQTGEVIEPNYKKGKKVYPEPKPKYQQQDLIYAASSPTAQKQATIPDIDQQRRFASQPTGQIFANKPIQPTSRSENQRPNARSDINEAIKERQPQLMMAQESAYADAYAKPSYNQPNNYDNKYPQQEFVPGGFVNLQLSGPTGGPKMTYQDYDREEWARKLSQTPGAMPYPILNYQQLQNFYGGLGTFTNGLAENRYTELGLVEKIKSVLNKFHHMG